METERIEAPRATSVLAGAGFRPRLRTVGVAVFVAAYLAATALVAHSDLGVQSLVLVAAVFGVLAISLDLVAGMLGLYSLGQGGFFAIGAYFTTIVVNDLGWNVFLVLLIVLLLAGLIGLAVGAMSLRVSGLYFAITTFIFTLVLTVLATDLKITGGLQGLLGPAFPDFPEGLEALGAPVAWCVMLALLLCMGFVWSIRQSPLYPVLLSIRDAERFAEAAGARTSLIKIGVFGVSAAMAGGAGWLFSFLGVVSPGQFDWSVSLNILVMVLIGGINTTLGAGDRRGFRLDVPRARQHQSLAAGDGLWRALDPGGDPAAGRRDEPPQARRRAWRRRARRKRSSLSRLSIAQRRRWRRASFASSPAKARARRKQATPSRNTRSNAAASSSAMGPASWCCATSTSRSGAATSMALSGPNGSGKSTLANVIAGRLQPLAGSTLIKGMRVDGASPSKRAKLGMRRTFQAAELVRELTPVQNVMVGLFNLKPRIIQRAAIWPLLPSGRRDLAWMEGRSREALEMVGAGAWVGRAVGDVPHGVEQLTQLASVCVAGPDIIILDEPATGLSAREVDHLAEILTHLKAQGVTMIIIEHQTRFLFPLCDQVTVLNAGEVILTGTADEVRAHPVVRQVYLGE